MPSYYRYGQIEAALVEVFNVPGSAFGAFRAKLRHLRNIGVPKIAKVGSGKQVRYTRENAIEMLLALEFVALGIAPRYAATYAAGGTAKIFAEDSSYYDGYLFINPQPFDFPWLAGTPRNIKEWVKSISTGQEPLPQRFALINVLRSINNLDEALLRLIADKKDT